MSFINVLMNYT